MIKTILTATDGSHHAVKALELASDLAGKYGAKLVILHVMGRGDVPTELVHMAEAEHVVDPPTPDASLPRAAVGRAGSKYSGETRQIHAYIGESILHEAEKVASSKGLKDIERVMAGGDAAHRILETAENKQADMIVIGSRGLSNLKSLLVGSVSHKVSHLATCTCVCVK